MLEEFISIILGCLAGIITGLIPGIHINTIASLFSKLSLTGMGSALFIVSLSMVHSFVAFIPCIVLGAPDSENFLSILPGHKFLLQGKAFYAIKLTVAGGLIAGIISLMLLPFYGLFLLEFEKFFPLVIPAILGGLLMKMIFSEKGSSTKLFSLAVILLSGLLGLMILRGFLPVRNGLFVLVTGFFGASTLIYSLTQKPVFKKQDVSAAKFNFSKIFLPSLTSVFAGLIVSIFPGIGAAQAAFIAKEFFGKIDSSRFLVLLGGINTANLLFSFFAAHFIGKTRTGAALAVKEMINLTTENMQFFFPALLLSLAFGVIVTLILAKILLIYFQKLDYFKINLIVLIMLMLLVFWFAGWLGLIVYLTAASIGLIAVCSGIKRTHAMAFLIFPVMLYYLFV